MKDLRAAKSALQAKGPNPTFAIIEAVLAAVSAAELKADGSEERAALMERVTPGQAWALAINKFEMEVNAGGLDSYLRCAAGDHATRALAGLIEIRALKFAAVLSETLSLFPKGEPITNTDKRAGQLDRILARNPTALQNLDAAFFNAYEGEESLGKLLVAYFCSHQTDFVR